MSVTLNISQVSWQLFDEMRSCCSSTPGTLSEWNDEFVKKKTYCMFFFWPIEIYIENIKLNWRMAQA